MKMTCRGQTPVFKAMRRLIKIGICPLLLLMLETSAGAMSSRPTRPIVYPVRVAVVTDAPAITMKISGAYEIYSLPLLEPLKKGVNLNNVSMKPTISGVLMGDEELNIYGVKIKADKTTDIVIDRRTFRGEMDIIRTEKMGLLVVNHLDIEDYIAGVLYHEVSHWWPMEAIKAQAIASRSFALYRSVESKNKDFDLSSDIYSQVYGGKTSEKFRTNRAVSETAGKVLIYKNKLLPAYFHATCGGHTEDASLLWKTDLAPLKGRPCGYCESSPHYSWQKEIPLESLESLLNKSGYKIKGIKDIKTFSTDPSGRVKEVHVIDSLGVEKITSNKFRLAVDPNIIKSTMFQVSVKDGRAVFEGKGWGHGVGMCQWGAYSMARRGLKAEDILMFYYPGAGIVDLKDIVKE